MEVVQSLSVTVIKVVCVSASVLFSLTQLSSLPPLQLGPCICMCLCLSWRQTAFFWTKQNGVEREYSQSDLLLSKLIGHFPSQQQPAEVRQVFFFDPVHFSEAFLRLLLRSWFLVLLGLAPKFLVAC